MSGPNKEVDLFTAVRRVLDKTGVSLSYEQAVDLLTDVGLSPAMTPDNLVKATEVLKREFISSREFRDFYIAVSLLDAAEEQCSELSNPLMWMKDLAAPDFYKRRAIVARRARQIAGSELLDPRRDSGDGRRIGR